MQFAFIDAQTNGQEMEMGTTSLAHFQLCIGSDVECPLLKG